MPLRGAHVDLAQIWEVGGTDDRPRLGCRDRGAMMYLALPRWAALTAVICLCWRYVPPLPLIGLLGAIMGLVQVFVITPARMA